MMNSVLREYKLFCPSEKWKLLLTDYAVLILNTPIRISPKYMEPLWTQAQYRVCVDGGANRWLNYAEKYKICQNKLLPELVSGDFDSAKSDVIKKLEKDNVKVVPTPDQDDTDFTKALRELAKVPNKFSSVLVLVEASGGRLDHTFSNINTLVNSKEIFDRPVDVYLVGRSCVTWLLHPGSHRIHVPHWIKQYPCGILPFSPRPSVVTTTGLRWNLSGNSIEFGGLISSSNQFTEESEVTVLSDTPLVWTMSIDSEDEPTEHDLHHKI